MKAAVFDQTGTPSEVLAVREVDAPVPTRGEVAIRMLTASINPSDLMYIRGNYGLRPKCPATPGFEGVGVVESSGGGFLANRYVGKRVVVLNDRRGNWAEQTTALARQCIPVPTDFTDEQAATFFVNPATALAITSYVFRIPKGAWLLQTAAGSALGKMVIRLGKSNGFRTVNVVRRPEQIDELKKLGADEVVLEADIFENRVRSLGDEGVPFVMDAVGGETGTRAVSCLASGGRAILYGLLSGEPISLDPRFLITGSKSIQGFWLGDWIKTLGIARKLMLIRRIRSLIRTGMLATDVGQTYSLDQVNEAVRKAEEPGRGGKVLLRIGS